MLHLWLRNLKFYKSYRLFVPIQHPWNAPFVGREGWGPNSPKYFPILLKFSPELVLKGTKTVYQEFSKKSNFYSNGRYPKFALLVQLWPYFTPWRLLKLDKTKKIRDKESVIRLSKYVNLRLYLLYLSNEK